ncbi:MAG TPA: hypothetical protein VGS00_06780 [Thermoanaerobaculia bacterium]|nr:hypothetical protein [Thermoanaerobaculia bacterium]
MKTTLILVLFGALLGIAGASVAVPPALSWYNEPGALQKGGQVQSIVNIPEVIRYTTDRLIKSQAIGAAIGAGMGLVVGLFAASKKAARVTAPAAKA